jgi:hypothetical protein
MLLAAPGRLAATTFGAPITAIQRKLPQDRASASDSGKYIRADHSLLFTANRHDHAYRCRRSDRVLFVLHGHLHIGPPPILAQKHAPSCGRRGGSGTCHDAVNLANGRFRPCLHSRRAGFPKRPPIFNQRLPKYDQQHKSRQHQRCEHHLNDRETGRVFAKKPTCNKAASTQEPVSGPSEPIKHISLRRPLSSTRDSPPAPRAIWVFVPTMCPSPTPMTDFPIARNRSGRSSDWLKSKNPACTAVKREAEEDWGR